MGSAERDGHPGHAFPLYDGRIGFAFHLSTESASGVAAAVRRVRTEVRQQADDNQRVGGVRMLVAGKVRVVISTPVDVVDVGKTPLCFAWYATKSASK